MRLRFGCYRRPRRCTGWGYRVDRYGLCRGMCDQNLRGKYHHPIDLLMITDLPPCPVETTLLLISDKWVVLILRDLRTGTKRFGELLKSVTGISQKVLTEKLRSMEEHELVSRTVYPEVPPRVEYSLTELGQTLYPVLDALETWGWNYKTFVADSQDRGA